MARRKTMRKKTMRRRGKTIKRTYKRRPQFRRVMCGCSKITTRCKNGRGMRGGWGELPI